MIKVEPRVKKNLSLDAKTAKALEAHAKKLKLPMGRIIDMALRAYFKSIKENGSMSV